MSRKARVWVAAGLAFAGDIGLCMLIADIVDFPWGYIVAGYVFARVVPTRHLLAGMIDEWIDGRKG